MDRAAATTSRSKGSNAKHAWIVPVAGLVGLVVGLLAGAHGIGTATVFAMIAAIVVRSQPTTIRSKPEPTASVFLREMRAKGVLDDATFRRLIDELVVRGVAAPAQTERDAAAPPVAMPNLPTREERGTRRPPAAHPPARPTPPPPVVASAASTIRTPPRWRRLPGRAKLARAWQSLVSDFAVQGLGSLGVLLVFTGTLGFVLFAFTEVGTAFRPAAELALPAVLAGLAVFLHRRGASFVGGAMEFLAGAVLPIMVFAAFVDGASVPPDLAGLPLVGMLAAAASALAVIYAAVVRRRPESPLRYLVGPLAWIAAGVLGLVIHAGPSAAQMALATGAVAGTAWLLRLRRPDPAASPTWRVCAPALAVGYGLTLAFAAGEGWSLPPMVAGGLIVVLGLEALQPPSPFSWLSHAGVVAITIVAGFATWPPAWVGVLGVVLFLGLAERWSRSVDPDGAVAVMLAGAGATMLATLGDPAAVTAAAAVVTTWTHVRRPRPLTWSSAPATVLMAAAAPFILVAGVAGWLGTAVALLAGAAALVVAHVFVRKWLPGDVFYALWIPAAAVVLAIGVAATLPIGSGEYLPSVTWALLIVPFAVSWLPAGSRVWPAAVLLAAAAASAAEAAGIAFDVRLAVFALAGVAVTTIAVGLSGPTGGHVALVGHTAALAALAAGVAARFDVLATATAGNDWLIVALLVAWTLTWLLEVVTDPTAPLQRLFADRPRRVGAVSEAILLVSIPVVVLVAAGLIWPAAQPTPSVLTLGGLALSYSAATRWLDHRSSLRTMLSLSGMALAGFGELLTRDLSPYVDPDRWVIAASLAAVIASVIAMTGSHRRGWMFWIAWAASAPLAALGAIELGVERSAEHWGWFAWGAAAGLGALFMDDHRHGRRSPGTGIRTAWLAPPAWLGSGVAALSLSPAFAVPFADLWPPSIVVAAFSLMLAVRLRLGSLSTISWAAGILAVTSLGGWFGWDLAADPWLLVVPAVVAGLAGLLLADAGAAPWRWDLPALSVAATTATIAVASGYHASATATTWLPIGLGCLVIGAVRRWPAVGVVGTLLVLGAAAIASPAWLAAALITTSLAAGVAATSLPRVQLPLQWTSALAGGLAWAQLLIAIGAGLDPAITSTLVGSAVSAGCFAFAAVLRGEAEWVATRLGPWAAVAAIGLIGAALAMGIDPRSSLLWIATASFLAWTAASARVAASFGVDGLRGAAVILGIASLVSAGFAFELQATGWVALLLVAAMAGTVLGLAIWLREPASRWLPFVASGVLGLDLGAAAVALTLWPNTTLLSIVALAAAAQAMAAGVIGDNPRLIQAAPPLLYTAWVASIGETMGGDVQWITTPAAIAVLAVVEIGRVHRRRLGRTPVTSNALLAAELSATALLVVPAFAQTILVALPFGLLAVVQGIGLATWGAVSHVRRRVFAGAAASVTGALLMVALPLATMVPQIDGIALWATLGAIGAVLITVAATVEQMRRRVANVRRTWHELSNDWE